MTQMSMGHFSPGAHLRNMFAFVRSAESLAAHAWTFGAPQFQIDLSRIIFTTWRPRGSHASFVLQTTYVDIVLASFSNSFPKYKSSYVLTQVQSLTHVAMSSLSLPRRLSQANSSSTSVSSWDIAAARSPPRAQSWNSAKPLPPTPTRPGIPSSKFNVYVEDLLPKTPTLFGNAEDLLPPNKVYHSSKPFSSSTSDLPDKLPNRPRIRRDAKTQVEISPGKARKNIDSTIFKEWKAPKYASSDDEVDPDSPSLGKILETNTQDSNGLTPVAERHAAGYMSVLHACDALLPSFDTESYSTQYNEVPPDMSASMTDIVDEYLVPHALRLSLTEESQPSSHFSSDSEGASDYERGVKKFRLRAKKAFHSRKTSDEKAEKIKLGSSSSRASKTGSMSPSERAGIQESIIDMSNTQLLKTKLSPKKFKARPVQRRLSDTSNRKNTRLRKQRHHVPPSPLGQAASIDRRGGALLKPPLPAYQLQKVSA
ncbi:hypothetical protein N7G274_005801 [Stereocaulon virgatum]|uniref:Uncharacterized protein n=1 Tax=Stereocaulon virgatum TaxID=373712 RepID=A0ABR4A9J4_9LECA